MKTSQEHWQEAFLKKRKAEAKIYSIVGAVLFIAGAIFCRYSYGEPVGLNLIIGILLIIRSTYFELMAYGFRQDIRRIEAPEDL